MIAAASALPAGVLFAFGALARRAMLQFQDERADLAVPDRDAMAQNYSARKAALTSLAPELGRPVVFRV